MKSRTQLIGTVWCVGLTSFSTMGLERTGVEASAEIYAQRCAGCHGENLHNVSGGWSFDCGACGQMSITDSLIRSRAEKTTCPPGTAFSKMRKARRFGPISGLRSTNKIASERLATQVKRSVDWHPET